MSQFSYVTINNKYCKDFFNTIEFYSMIITGMDICCHDLFNITSFNKNEFFKYIHDFFIFFRYKFF